MRKRSQCCEATQNYLAKLDAIVRAVEEVHGYYVNKYIPRREYEIVLFDTTEFIMSVKKKIIDIEGQMFRDRGLVAQMTIREYEKFMRKQELREQRKQNGHSGKDNDAAA
jgi:hypothetical protein